MPGSPSARDVGTSVVTFDLFSALIDSRRGGGAALGRIGQARGWPVSGEDLYDSWDRLNKQAQRNCEVWVPYPDLAHAALAVAYRERGLDGDADADVTTLLDSLPHWPLWPDVTDVLPALVERHRVGILSNVDDDLFARTRVAGLVDPALVITSERLQAYKPARRFYDEAVRRYGPLVHVATSARDVRGSIEAGLPVIRLRRPGHELGVDAPAPEEEADGMAALLPLLERALRAP